MPISSFFLCRLSFIRSTFFFFFLSDGSNAQLNSRVKWEDEMVVEWDADQNEKKKKGTNGKSKRKKKKKTE